MPPEIIDTHCHLTSPDLYPYWARIVNDAHRAGVSRMITGVELPFHPWSLRALALSAGSAELLDRPQLLAALVPRGGRVVVETPGADVAERLSAAGARVLARDARWIVAMRETS